MYVHYTLFFAIMSLFGAAIILVGLLRRFIGSNFSVKLLAYKSKMCKHSLTNWREAQRYNGKMMAWSGLWIAFIGFVLLPVPFSDEYSLILSGTIIPVTVLVFRFFTERHLRRRLATVDQENNQTPQSKFEAKVALSNT